MKVSPMDLPDVLLIELDRYPDARGCLFEAYQLERYRAAGIDVPFFQDNVSISRRGVLRGLHLQNPGAQAKLITALQGEIFDVAVDVRVGSPTFGRWTATVLSPDNGRQMFIPAGFAHGLYALSERIVAHYKCGAPFRPQAALAIAWDDPDIRIAWPDRAPQLSDKDARNPRLAAVPLDRLPVYTAGQ